MNIDLPRAGASYAGVGSRETPPQVLAVMRSAARVLASRGWILRSGGALGADSAFEAGAGLLKRSTCPGRAFASAATVWPAPPRARSPSPARSTPPGGGSSGVPRCSMPGTATRSSAGIFAPRSNSSCAGRRTGRAPRRAAVSRPAVPRPPFAWLIATASRFTTCAGRWSSMAWFARSNRPVRRCPSGASRPLPTAKPCRWG